MKQLEKPLNLFCFIFVLLLATDAQHLADPPYWDAIMGIYAQGLWLRDHHFNYALLLQSYNAQDAAFMYPFCLFAPLFGLLISLFPPPTVFVILHLIIFMSAAAAMVLFFRILRTACPFESSVLWILSAAVAPMWRGQVVSLYVEIPLCMMTGVSIYFLWRRRYALAAWAAVLGYFIKNSALLLATAYVVFAGLLLLRSRFARERPRLPRSVLWLFLPLPLLLFLNQWSPPWPLQPEWNLREDARTFMFCITHFFPYFAALTLLALAFFARRLRSKGLAILDKQEDGFMTFLAIYIAGFWASFFIHDVPMPRYFLMMLFPLTCLLGFLLAKRHTLSRLVAGTVIVIGLLNQNGGWLPAIPLRDGRSGHYLERSREYLIDLEANRSICALLEEQCFDKTIVAKWPFTHMLTHPEFGYVRRPLPRVVEASMESPDNSAVYWIPWLRSGKQRKSICIYSPNIFETRHGPSLLPQPNEIILFREDSLPAPVLIFMRFWEIKQPAGSIQRKDFQP